VDVTASPLALLAKEAEFSQRAAQDIVDSDAENRSSLFYEAATQHQQGQYAGINVTGQKLAGLASAQQQTMQAAQTRLDLYNQRAAASAARTGAAGNLFTQFGNLAGNYYQMKYKQPKA
jgi:hypothetical protein